MSTSDPVGVGETYEPIRAAARDLLPLFLPTGVSCGTRWGASLVEIEATDEGHKVSITYPHFSRWAKDLSNSVATTADLDEIRATAITLLAYCEAKAR